MIVGRQIAQHATAHYEILAHVMDGQYFVTLYRAGAFVHHTEWTTEERALADAFLAQAQGLTRQPSQAEHDAVRDAEDAYTIALQDALADAGLEFHRGEDDDPEYWRNMREPAQAYLPTFIS